MKKQLPIIIISILAIALRLWWTSYTNYTAEDAHISFQFAKQIAAGNGFVFNAGERIYGTTTPLLTLLLALWLLVSSNIVLGAKLIGLFTSIGGLWFLYFAIPYRRAAILATFLLATSMKLIAEEMIGMETPLLLLFLSAAYWGYVKDRPYFSGVMCGLLLWTRIDSIAFVVALFLSFLFFGTLGRLWTSTVKFAIGTFAYVPWLVFAYYYFGSPVPYTITAKIVAYGINNPSLPVHFLRIIDYLTWPVFLLTIASILYLGKRNLFLAVFFTANFLTLAWCAETVEVRYFYTLTIVSIVMIAFMVAREHNRLAKIAIILAMIYFPFNWNSQVEHAKSLQENRNIDLIEIGRWINANTPEDSTILLEPLGYVSYYANRTMLDEVGLVTPQVVVLHKAGIKGIDFYAHLWPDYILLQCTENPSDAFYRYYEMVKRFDSEYQRSCYSVWEMK